MIHAINGSELRRLLLAAGSAIELNKEHINELNVFPVPDGDTGTNMSMTFNAAVPELQKLPSPTASKVADTMASSLLRGARGNSGVILSLLFRGMSKTMKGAEECDGALFAKSLTAGVEAAYKAVMKPAEGTILTVSRLAAASASDFARKNKNFEAVLEKAVKAAEKALAETVNQNPTLKKAGVVDAGGKGWLTILDAMLRALRGEEFVPVTVSKMPVKEQADFSEFESGEITFAFDTVFIVRKQNADIDLSPLRSYLNNIGDCLVIGEDDEAFKVHVHTNIPGDALSEAQKYGTLELAKIENMRLQADALAEGRTAISTDDLEKIEEELEAENTDAAEEAAPEKRYGIVSVCAGDGLASVFTELGADGIISGGQTMNPSTQDILTAIRKTPAEIVFVFPNNKNIIMAAEQTVELTEKKVIVIPSKTIPQGITALLNFDPDAEPEDNTAAMLDAMGNVDTMQITYAARDSDFDGHDIHAGDYLALFGSALYGTDKDVSVLLRGLAEKAKEAGRSCITIFYGEDLSEEEAQLAQKIFEEVCPKADIATIQGGQPVYYYLISAE
ncbi:MAG: DAK2 domain-containing protein [Clostridia bacterium]|nr:DAK2 domain-containing protein [Clostridia bacterium]